jgi:sugar lactone lactonase YvrE
MQRALRCLGICLLALCSASEAQKSSIVTVAGGFLGDHKAATAASFAFPAGLAFDTNGNLYISDSNNCLIREVTTKNTITTFAGNGNCGYGGDGGRPSAAMFSPITALVFDSQGNLLVVDSANCRIRKISPSGMITTIAGNGIFGYSGDEGPATQANLGAPRSIALDAVGNLYIADQSNYVVRLVDTAGIIHTVAGNHSSGHSGDNGPATAAQIGSPSGVAVDSIGNFYVADSFNYIRKIDTSGIITTVAGIGFSGNTGDGGPGTLAAIGFPQALLVNGNLLYIGTTSSVWALDLDSDIIHLSAGAANANGFAGDGGLALSAYFNNIVSFAVDGSGNLLLADSENNRVREINSGSQIVSTLAGGSLGDGRHGVDASLNLSFGGHIATDVAGNVYIADTQNNLIRKVSPKGTITTVAGIGTSGYSGDNGPATSAQLWRPTAVALDTAGNMFIADSGDGSIRKVDSAGTITTVQIHTTGFQFFFLFTLLPSLAVDNTGNLYISDGLWAVWKIDPSGNAAIVAGTEFSIGYGGDNGPATQAMLNAPTGVALDSAGNLYIADWLNQRIRKVDTNGIISTFAGTGVQGFYGDGGPATNAHLSLPIDVATDAAGNIYIADWINARIRVVDSSGTINTFAGSGGFGYNGNRLSPLQTNVVPMGIAVNPAGQLYYSDNSEYRVRTIQ